MALKKPRLQLPVAALAVRAHVGPSGSGAHGQATLPINAAGAAAAPLLSPAGPRGVAGGRAPLAPQGPAGGVTRQHDKVKGVGWVAVGCLNMSQSGLVSTALPVSAPRWRTLACWRRWTPTLAGVLPSQLQLPRSSAAWLRRPPGPGATRSMHEISCNFWRFFQGAAAVTDVAVVPTKSRRGPCACFHERSFIRRCQCCAFRSCFQGVHACVMSCFACMCVWCMGGVCAGGVRCFSYVQQSSPAP